MKVDIGPYLDWWGPYQIADLLQKVGVSEDRCDKIGDYLSGTVVNKWCEWVHAKRHRKIKVKTDQYDHWAAYHTLSLVIHPVLVDLRNMKHGAGFIDDEDVPKELRSTNCTKPREEWDSDSLVFQRYDWVLDEMIYAFGVIKDDEEDDMRINLPDEEWKKVDKRIQHGLFLFGKYFRTLWD